MHKIAFLILVIISALSLSSCNMSGFTDNKDNDKNTPGENSGGESDSGNSQNKFILTATVTDVSDRLMVNVTSGEYAEGIYSVIIADGAPLLDKSGKSISLSDISVGDTVKITYNGQTMMSYPPQIVARKIVLE